MTTTTEAGDTETVDGETRPAPARVRWLDANTVTVLVSLTALALAAGLFTVSSLALFTDQETVGLNDFSTGDVDIATAPTFTVLQATAMVPGDQVTNDLVVTNNGSLDLRYSVSSTTTEDVLAAGLVLTVKSGVTDCSDGGWQASGAVLYSGPVGSTGGVAVLGDPTPGADTGDRTLAPTASETLCLNVTLPVSATSTVQGLSTTATLTFDAEQTVNNP